MTSLAYSNFEVTGPAGVAGALNVGGRWESGLLQTFILLLFCQLFERARENGPAFSTGMQEACPAPFPFLPSLLSLSHLLCVCKLPVQLKWAVCSKQNAGGCS